MAALFSTIALLVCYAGVVVAHEHDGGHGHSHGHGHDHEHGHGHGHGGMYSIGLWGDLPYSKLQATVGLDNLIADMNAHDLAFSVHDGDLKEEGPCDKQLYLGALKRFNQFESAAMFTTGDNDWTDCDEPSNGGYNALGRLDYERKVFFSTPYSLGQRPIEQEVQEHPLCLGEFGYVRCVENRRWSVNGVTYMTANVQGSCNNLCYTGANKTEWEVRTRADIAWLQQTFQEAKRSGAKAVMILTQGDPGFDQLSLISPQRNATTLAETDANPDGYQPWLLAVREQVIAFRRPVVYVHGDSHMFRVDKPLLDEAGARVETFTRVETFGDHPENGLNDCQWVRVIVEPSSREVFSFQPMIVPGNRVAVPLP